MIRQVEFQDAKAITDIYNEYVLHSVATFDTEPVQEEEMRARITEISSRFPYFVYEEDKEITGYCYAHTWKERSAYRYTLETTVYLSPGHTGKGIGMLLMQRLIEACRENGYRALIACITEGNEASNILHERLGFKQDFPLQKGRLEVRPLAGCRRLRTSTAPDLRLKKALNGIIFPLLPQLITVKKILPQDV